MEITSKGDLHKRYAAAISAKAYVLSLETKWKARVGYGVKSLALVVALISTLITVVLIGAMQGAWTTRELIQPISEFVYRLLESVS